MSRVIAHLGQANVERGGLDGRLSDRGMMIDATTGGSIQLCVTPEIDLSKLTVAEKDALILSLLPLVGRLGLALAASLNWRSSLAEFERRPKTPDNSSLLLVEGTRPSSTGAKRRAKAVPASDVRWANPDHISSMPRSTPACAPPSSPGRTADTAARVRHRVAADQGRHHSGAAAAAVAHVAANVRYAGTARTGTRLAVRSVDRTLVVYLHYARHRAATAGRPDGRHIQPRHQ